MPKRIYVAATRQNDGKTTFSLGMIPSFLERGYRVGYIKPVGQRVIKSGGATVDEDVLLIRGVYGIQGNLQDTSPVGIPKGFTERYIHNEISSDLPKRIMEAFENVARQSDVVIIEGTGHAGVGSVVDLSNARVAKMLNCETIIVTLGGIGRPFDEIALNQALFKQEGVNVLGVVANKVQPEKLEKIRHTLDRAFDRIGIELLGAIPTVDLLEGPTVAQVLEDTGARLISGARDLTCAASSFVVGTSTPEFVTRHFREATLLITSGDREDLIEAALQFSQQSHHTARLVAVVLTDGLVPGPHTLAALEQAQIPVLSVDTPCYKAANQIHDLLVKIRPSDFAKIEIARKLIRQHVNVDRIIEKMGL